MSKAPDDLVLKLLREIRAEQDVAREHLHDLRDQMAQLRKDMHDWQETIATASGFAVHASIRGQALEKEVAQLKKPVEKLEKTK